MKSPIAPFAVCVFSVGLLSVSCVFPALAATYGARLYPDLLAGVARSRALNQPDGVHPNARGVQVIARGLAPVVARALAAAG